MQREKTTFRSDGRSVGGPVSFEEARAIVDAEAGDILEREAWQCDNLDLPECLGRVLAAPVVADRDQPPFARVTRDGFAVRFADVAAGTSLRLIGGIRAGEIWDAGRQPLQPGEAIEIMTGAPLPPGTDAILMVEHAERSSAAVEGTTEAQDRIVPERGRKLQPGENVVPQGSEARQGQTLIEPGTRLGPDAIGLAASCGMRSLRVYRQPHAAVLSTGDEIVELLSRNEGSQTGVEPHQIYDSNSQSLSALVREAGASPLRQAAARDRKEDLVARIQKGLDAAPLLLITGGVSMGRYDLVEEVLAELGAEFLFTGVKIQPGKPVVFARVPGGPGERSRYVFGLPGNPVSAMVTFRLFARPILAALGGESNWQPRYAMARLASEVQVKPGLTRFLPAHLDTRQPLPTATPTKTQGSGDLAANARANCYIIVPEDCERCDPGHTVRVLLR